MHVAASATRKRAKCSYRSRDETKNERVMIRPAREDEFRERGGGGCDTHSHAHSREGEARAAAARRQFTCLSRRRPLWRAAAAPTLKETRVIEFSTVLPGDETQWWLKGAIGLRLEWSGNSEGPSARGGNRPSEDSRSVGPRLGQVPWALNNPLISGFFRNVIRETQESSETHGHRRRPPHSRDNLSCRMELTARLREPPMGFEDNRHHLRKENAPGGMICENCEEQHLEMSTARDRTNQKAVGSAVVAIFCGHPLGNTRTAFCYLIRTCVKCR